LEFADCAMEERSEQVEHDVLGEVGNVLPKTGRHTSKASGGAPSTAKLHAGASVTASLSGDSTTVVRRSRATSAPPPASRGEADAVRVVKNAERDARAARISAFKTQPVQMSGSANLDSASASHASTGTATVDASASVAAASESLLAPSAHSQGNSTSVSTLESGGGVCVTAACDAPAAAYRQTSGANVVASSSNDDGDGDNVAPNAAAKSTAGDSVLHSNSDQGGAVLEAAAGARDMASQSDAPPPLECDDDDASQHSGDATGAGEYFSTPAPVARIVIKVEHSEDDDDNIDGGASSAAASLAFAPGSVETPFGDIAYVAAALLNVITGNNLAFKGDQEQWNSVVLAAQSLGRAVTVTDNQVLGEFREALYYGGAATDDNSANQIVRALEEHGGSAPIAALGGNAEDPWSYVYRNVSTSGGGDFTHSLVGAHVSALLHPPALASVRVYPIIKAVILAGSVTSPLGDGDDDEAAVELVLHVQCYHQRDVSNLRLALKSSLENFGGFLFDDDATQILARAGEVRDCVLKWSGNAVQLRMQFVVDELSKDALSHCLPASPFDACDQIGLRRVQNDGGNSSEKSVNACMWLGVAAAAVDAVANGAGQLPDSSLDRLATAIRQEAEKRACSFAHNLTAVQAALASLAGRVADCEVVRLELGGGVLEVGGELEYSLAQLVLLGVLAVSPLTPLESRSFGDLLEPFPWSDFASTPWEFVRLDGIVQHVRRGRAFRLLTDALIQFWSDADGDAHSAAMAGVAEAPDELVSRLFRAHAEHRQLYMKNNMGGEAALETAAAIMKDLRISIASLIPMPRSLHVQRLAGVTPGVGSTMPTGVVVHGGGVVTYLGGSSSAVSNGLPRHFEAVTLSKASAAQVLAKLNLAKPARVDQFVKCAQVNIRNLARNFASGSQGSSNDLRALTSSTSSSAQSLASTAVSEGASSAPLAASSAASSLASASQTVSQTTVPADSSAAAASANDASAMTSTSVQSLAASAPSVDSSSASAAASSEVLSSVSASQGASQTVSSVSGASVASSSDAVATAATSSSSSPPPPPPPPSLPAFQPASPGKPEAVVGSSAAGSSQAAQAALRRGRYYCYNCGKPGHYSINCDLPPNNQNCYGCGLAGHKVSDCPGSSGGSEASASAASSLSGGVASGSGRCECGNLARKGLTTCSLCAGGPKKPAQQGGAPVGLNPTGSASNLPVPSRSAWKSTQAVAEAARDAAEELMKLRREALQIVEERSPTKRRLAVQALNHGETPEYVLQALCSSKTYCMLGQSCEDSNCRKPRHSLPPTDVVSSSASSGSAAGAKSTSASGATANSNRAGASTASLSSRQPVSDSAGSSAGVSNYARGGYGGGRGRGGASGVPRAGPAPGHGGEKNGGAQPGGASPVSSASSASLSAAAPVAAATASAASDPVLMARVDNIEGALASIMSQLGVLAAASVAAAAAAASSAAPTSAAATAAASGAQQTVAGSQ